MSYEDEMMDAEDNHGQSIIHSLKEHAVKLGDYELQSLQAEVDKSIQFTKGMLHRVLESRELSAVARCERIDLYGELLKEHYTNKEVLDKEVKWRVDFDRYVENRYNY